MSRSLKDAINSSLEKNKSRYRIADDAFYTNDSTSLFEVECEDRTVVLKAVKVNKDDKYDAVENADMYDPYRLFKREISSFKRLKGEKSKYTVQMLEGPFEAELENDKEAYFLIMERYIPIISVHKKKVLKYRPQIEIWIENYGLDCVMAYMGYCISKALKELQGVRITAQRDIKPANIYIDREDEDMFKCRFILGDFGTAHIDGANATNPSSQLGTMYYIPGNNEDNTDWRYDQFMLGINLYEPFNGSVIAYSIDRKYDERYSGWASGKEDIPEPLKSMPDDRLWETIKKMTSYDVSVRYADVDSLISEFENLYTVFAEESGHPVSEKVEPDSPKEDKIATKIIIDDNENLNQDEIPPQKPKTPLKPKKQPKPEKQPKPKKPVKFKNPKKKRKKKFHKIPVIAAILLVLVLLSIPFSKVIENNRNIKSGNNCLESQDYEGAKNFYLQAADNGSTKAQVLLGNCYYYGQGVTQDYNKAVEWYRKSANQGNAAAQNNLGFCYGHGHGVTQDYNEAVEWYRKSADQGYAAAQNSLGYCYQYGYGVSQDYNKAVDWYQKAAEQGLAAAQNNLGDCYQYGYGVPQDYNNAVEWYRKAADQGNAAAQNNLGYCYEHGHGVPQDYNEAVEWYRKSADQGNAAAQNNLGNCYYYGHGVTQDYNNAVEWYQKAADNGSTDAQYNLIAHTDDVDFSKALEKFMEAVG